MVKSDFGSAPELPQHVRSVERGDWLTVYYLERGLSREQRLEVLACLRERHPGVEISCVGDEIAVGAVPIA
jgi:hypothetical protein